MHPATGVQTSTACWGAVSANANRWRRRNMSDVLGIPECVEDARDAA